MASVTVTDTTDTRTNDSSGGNGSNGWLGWFARPLMRVTGAARDTTNVHGDDDITNVIEGVPDTIASSSSSSMGSSKEKKKLSGIRVEAASAAEVAQLRAQNAELMARLQELMNAQHTATSSSLSSSSSSRSSGPPPLHELSGLKLHFLPIDMELPQPPSEPSATAARDFYDKLSSSLHLPSSSLPPSLKKKRGTAPSSSSSSSSTPMSMGMGMGMMPVPSSSSSISMEGKTEQKHDACEVEEGSTSSDDSKRVCDPDVDEVEGRPSRKIQPSGIGAVASTSTESVIVTAPPGDDESADSGAVQQVGVVDLANVEWWTMVEAIKDEDEDIYVNVESGDEGETTEVNTADDYDEDTATTAPSTLGGTYELVKEEDLCVALADYVALSMARYPEAKQLSSKEMQDMLDATFGKLKEPSTAGKLWSWGQFAYTTYGYGSWLYKLYRDPQLVKLVATGVWKAAQWAIVLVL